MHDAVLLFIDSLNSLKVTVDIQTGPIVCGESEKWPNGFTIVSYMKVKQPSISLTGPLKFDDMGRRIDFQLQLIELVPKKLIATWTPSMFDTVNFTRTESESVQAIVENLQKTTVIVASRYGWRKNVLMANN